MTEPDNRPTDPEQVDDPGEYNQRLRIQEIAEARKAANSALGGEYALRLDDTEWAEYALLQVQAFVSELEWLIRKNGDEEYITTELGPIEVPPPSKEDIEQSFKDRDNPIQIRRIISDVPEKKTISVTGLFSTNETGTGFADLPTAVSKSWEVNVDIVNKGPDKVTVTRQAQIPLEVTKRANSLCRRFINEAGLDARLEDQKPHIKL